jgi:hypothetical protein
MTLLAQHLLKLLLQRVAHLGRLLPSGNPQDLVNVVSDQHGNKRK